jgi:TrmH family RNA methyltransferase
MHAHGVRALAADPAATESYRGDHYRGATALVLGSERYGLSSEWRAAADVLVSIPMHGTADSLNVGHAAALLLYESLGGRDVRR